MKVSYHNLIFTIICLTFSLDVIEPAAVAKNEYFMDLRADCLSTGFLDVPRDQTVYVNARSTGTVNNQQLTCYLQFNPQTDGDTLKMWVESGSYISDCDVSLEMSMNDDKYVYGCQSSQNSLPNYQTINGKGTLRLIRKSYGDLDFGFKIGIKATKSMAAVTPGDSSSGNVGMIVGIVVGIIVAIVIATIICVCCYRKRHNNDTKNGGLLSKNALSASSTCTFDNTGAKNGGLDYPGSDRKLLGKDGIDYENEDRLKPKSALERFGPSPPKNQKASENVSDVKRREPELRQIPVPTARMIPNVSQRDRNESQGKNANIPAPPPIEALLSRQSSTVTSSSETMGERNERNGGSPGDRNSQGNNTIFAALRNNPKFRKSFRENEADAEDRAQRISSYTSTSSMASDTSKPQLPLLPATKSAKPELKKPQLPPVPKLRPRPSSPERRGEIAAIHRHRPSSSTSESSRLDVGKGDENVKSQKMKSTEASKSLPKKDGRRNDHSSDSEESEQSRGHRHRSKDRDKEPKRKQHADRRSRSNSKKKYHSDSEDSESSRGKSRHRHRSEDRDKDPKRRQHNERQGRKKSKDDFSSESEVSEIYKDIRSKSRGNTDDREDKRKQKPEEPSEEKRDRDYERKFVKSTGVRKSKGKGVHRMNRSKSTGSALEELESNYSQSKSAGSVKSLNFIDEDIDLDSNLQPFKRAGSKQSLYASRSSLYGRRRKNSMGETISLSSYMYDDVESRMSDFDRASISTKDKARMFKSTGDINLNMQTVKIVRDCSTWTGSSKCVEVFEKRPLTRGRHDKRYNRGTQTSSHKERNNSLASEASVHSTHRLKSRSKSQESLGSDRKRRTHKKDDRNKSPHHSRSDVRSNDGRSRSKSRAKSTDSDSTHYTVDSSDSGNTQRSTHKPKAKPKPKQRNLTDDDDDLESVISAAPSTAYNPYQPATNPQYIPVNYPVAPYPQPYLAPVPNAVPFVAPNVVMQKPAIAPKPVTQAPQSGGTKWDQLVNLTEGMKKRRHQMGESINETESVMSSAWSEFTPQVYVQDPNRTYSTSYPESSGPVPQYGYYHAPPSESNI